MAGGTGDVAFRVLRAIRRQELEDLARPRSSRPGPSASSPSSSSSSSGATAGASAAAPDPGSVVVCDINPKMLEVGRSKAKEAPDLAGGAEC